MLVPSVAPGTGGGMLIAAPPTLCADNANEFHLHYLSKEPPGETYVVEAAAGPSRCEWEFHDLVEGAYDTFIQVAPSGRILARAGVQVVKGVVTFVRLEPPTVEVEGQLTGAGLPARDLSLEFRSDGKTRFLTGQAAIDEHGSYRVHLDGQTDHYCAVVTATHRANALRKCGRFLPGLQRFDLAVAPGVIHVSVPPVSGATNSEWASVILRAPSAILTSALFTPDGPLVAFGSMMFHSRDGFEGDIIGVAYGDYTVELASDGDQSVRVSRRVTVTPEHPTTSVTWNLVPVRD